ncbi:hypothetical protein ACOMHN_056474 [Nucella lapillus]
MLSNWTSTQDEDDQIKLKQQRNGCSLVWTKGLNRPLGRLECRYQYKRQQPLLSCRTVETDASSGGEARAYVKSGGQRAVSACGMLQEQQK